MIPLRHSRRSARAFAADERAAATVFSLLLFMSLVMMGGLAVDVTNAITMRKELQVTSDAVAHAALVTRELQSEADSKTKAIAVAKLNMPDGQFGNVVTANDIVFGTWNPANTTFTPVSGSREAVMVTARQDSTNGNPLATFMLGLIGLDDWNVSAVTVYTSNGNSCISEGFVGQDVVDLQSNNFYGDGFCVHSNTGVKVSSGNTFESGTIVSMPSLSLLQMPASGWTSNEGITEALREGTLNIRIASRLAAVIDGIQNPASKFYPSYITDPTPIRLNTRNIAASNLTKGRIHTLTCNGNQNMRFSGGFTMKDVVIITNCDISFNQNVHIETSIIATTSTSKLSMTSASAFSLGNTDVCIPGGESQLVTLGSIKLTSKISVYGSQLLAAGDISFTSLGEGTRGVSFTAGGTISGTTNMSMEACGNMDGTNLQMAYFKMAY